MSSSQNIDVFVRVKPNDDPDEEGVITHSDRQIVVEDSPPSSFQFASRIVTGSNQVFAFSAIAAKLTQRLQEGFSCTLLAYGQTGSGKTFTMLGPPGCLTKAELEASAAGTPASWGIFPRLAVDLLENGGFTLHATAVEIYQDNAFDLLNNGKRISIGKPKEEVRVTGGSLNGVRRGQNGVHDANCLCGKCFVAKEAAKMARIEKIREAKDRRPVYLSRRSARQTSGDDASGPPQPSSAAGTTTTGMRPAVGSVSGDAFATVGETVLPLQSKSDIACLARTVELSRTAHGHLLNERSSRSHCIVRVYIKSRTGGGGMRRQQFCFVDLAGSERIHKSGVTGQRMTEALEINQSLSVLGRVILGLGRREEHVPWRDSTLTMLLKSAFDGHSCTAVVINVSDSARHIKETVSSLRFGERMVSVRPSVLANQSQSVAQQRAVESSLRDELAKKREQLRHLEAAGKGGAFGSGAVESEKVTFLANVQLQRELKERVDRLKVTVAEAKSGSASADRIRGLQREQTAITSRHNNIRDIVLRQKTIPNFWVAPSSIHRAIEAEVALLEANLKTL